MVPPSAIEFEDMNFLLSTLVDSGALTVGLFDETEGLKDCEEHCGTSDDCPAHLEAKSARTRSLTCRAIIGCVCQMTC